MQPKSGNTAPESIEATRRRHPLARGIELLTIMIDSDQETHGVRELANRIGVSPSTVHRLVTDLEKLGLLARTEQGNYQLGLEFMRMAWTTVDRYPIHEVSVATLEELTDRSGESSFFAVYGESRNHMMFSAVVESPHPLRYAMPVKRWIPLYAGASGLAILAFLPKNIIDDVIGGTVEPLTTRTLQHEKELRERIDTIAHDGYAITHGERIEGAIAIAAPVFGSSGTVVGSVGITMPEVRFNAAHTSSLSNLVRKSADRITEYLSGRGDLHTGALRPIR